MGEKLEYIARKGKPGVYAENVIDNTLDVIKISISEGEVQRAYDDAFTLLSQDSSYSTFTKIKRRFEKSDRWDIEDIIDNLNQYRQIHMSEEKLTNSVLSEDNLLLLDFTTASQNYKTSRVIPEGLKERMQAKVDRLKDAGLQVYDKDLRFQLGGQLKDIFASGGTMPLGIDYGQIPSDYSNIKNCKFEKYKFSPKG